MRVPNAVHRSRPWRIHEILGDFRLEDVWSLPTPGGPDDFPRLVRLAAAFDPAHSPSFAVRRLFALRWRLGELFGWDGDGTGVGSRVASLRGRLPADLRDAWPGPAFAALPFTPLYLCADESAAEIANRTMHGVAHLGWIADGHGGYHAEMAVYVKPNGVAGSAYLTAIRPFRRLLVYPGAMRAWVRAWRTQLAEPVSAA